MSEQIGLFYGSSTCYTEMAAEKIRDTLGAERVRMFNIADDEVLQDIEHFSFLIFGIPTWDYGELQEDWEACWDELDQIDFNGKKVAFFGLGDQIGYPQWFLDAMGYLHDKVINLGATPVAYWPNEGYEYDESKALTQDGTHFVGLALDEENEFDKSEARITQWCAQVLDAFGLPAHDG